MVKAPGEQSTDQGGSLAEAPFLDGTRVHGGDETLPTNAGTVGENV